MGVSSPGKDTMDSNDVDDLTDPLPDPDPGVPLFRASAAIRTQRRPGLEHFDDLEGIKFRCPICGRDSFTCGCYDNGEDSDE